MIKIRIRIRNADHEADIRFPISESELYAKLAEIHAIEGQDVPQSAFVTEVYWPEEFSMLKDRFANLDELNYLAKRMESFDVLEMDQFLVGISKLDSPTEKDLINLTFNLDHFTLCQDVSSYGKIGRAYEKKERRTMEQNHQDYHRGEIYFADLNPVFGHEQGGFRPVLILQNDTGNFYSPTVIVTAATHRAFKKPSQPTHVTLTDIDGLPGGVKERMDWHVASLLAMTRRARWL